MAQPFAIDFRQNDFFKLHATDAYLNRVNWRCEVLLTRNSEAIQNKTILDLACNDGKFSYACLRLGAQHVTGVEGRKKHVFNARQNLKTTGFREDQYEFIHGDAIDYLFQVKPKQFDTILCLGFLYHTARQIEFFREIKRIKPEYFILDTRIAEKNLSENKNPPFFKATFVHRLAKFLLMRWLLIGLKARYQTTRQEHPSLTFKIEDVHNIQYGTMDPIGLVAIPSKRFIEFMFEHHGFSFRKLNWPEEEIQDWRWLEAYRNSYRVSYLARSSRIESNTSQNSACSQVNKDPTPPNFLLER